MREVVHAPAAMHLAIAAPARCARIRPKHADADAAAAPVSVTVHHTYDGDLRVDSVAADGSVYNLYNRSGSSASDVIGTFTRTLTSEALNGTRKLRVNDHYSGDTGRIDTWSITF